MDTSHLHFSYAHQSVNICIYIVEYWLNISRTLTRVTVMVTRNSYIVKCQLICCWNVTNTQTICGRTVQIKSYLWINYVYEGQVWTNRINTSSHFKAQGTMQFFPPCATQVCTMKWKCTDIKYCTIQKDKSNKEQYIQLNIYINTKTYTPMKW